MSNIDVGVLRMDDREMEHHLQLLYIKTSRYCQLALDFYKQTRYPNDPVNE